jgi:hypothetical protein
MDPQLTAPILLVCAVVICALAILVLRKLVRKGLTKLQEVSFIYPAYGAVGAGLVVFILFTLDHFFLSQGRCVSRSCRKFQVITLPGVLFAQLIAKAIPLNEYQLWLMSATTGAIFWAIVFYAIDYFKRKHDEHKKKE